MSIEEAANAFVEGWKDAKEPSNLPDTEQPEETEKPDIEPTEDEQEVEDVEETEGEEQDEEDDAEDATENEEPEDGDEDEDSEDSEPKLAEDDAIIRFEVDGKTLELSVSDAKRLAGQEAAINTKARQLAAERETTSALKERAEASMNLMLKQAEERFKPYQEVDWVLAAKRLDEDELVALRSEAESAYKDYSLIKEGIDSYVKEQQEATYKQQLETIKKTKATLEDPEKGIPGFNQQVYGELLDYAVSIGFQKEVANGFITPEIFQLLHKAQQYDKGKAVATVKKQTTPKRTLRSKQAVPKKARTKATKQQAAMDNLRKSGGSIEAAADAFLAGWED